ncbi:alpha/beta hydrolase-fold protein [Elizabethkingia meningoseptica]|uniref:alpha/beta hydrolase-fold protein n=1 Tax=Elizabethkingia meningoseptica TaxID=238 RepID=UPI002013AF81|nr:alpha/beta hydrolase-fold protein [Elizabethkingia meningoseptica]MCL1673983.1 alpha/beta hydrolase-fold protein [Elizabethkingia meningoseptica]MCL1685376.1 alpha/beta hydrolase-fold protein [Elizabethkingia meningoseptica]
MKYTVIYIIFLLLCTTLNAQDTERVVAIGKRYSIDSRVLKEKRNYSVYLPPSYESNMDKKYFVAYVLDGEKSKFLQVAGIAQSMNSTSELTMQIPELIIVAIENTDRTRDFTPTHSLNYLDAENINAFNSSGKANEFMGFLEKELMPEIDKSYRTLSKNLIIGHSLGGLFAIHCLLESPNLFNYYILIDPSWFWDHNYIGKRTKEVLKTKNLEGRVYIALANNFKEDSRHYKWGNEFYEMLNNKKSPRLDAKIQYFEDEKHLTVPIPATYYGLRYIFDGFDMDINEIFKSPSLVDKHDKEMSEKLGVELRLDENFVNTLGYIALHDRNIPDAAVTLFEFNTKNYPLSPNVWDSLADAYMAKGMRDKAKACYEKILSLQPGNKDARSKLEKIKNQK